MTNTVPAASLAGSAVYSRRTAHPRSRSGGGVVDLGVYQLGFRVWG
jgi:hypothetical protein